MNRRIPASAGILCAALVAFTTGFFYRSGAPTAGSEPVKTGVVSPDGYTVRHVAGEFTAPVGVAVGTDGALFVAEAGTVEGTKPRVLKLEKRGRRTTLANDFTAPLTGLSWHDGKLYVSYVGGVDVLDPSSGLHHPVLNKLPAYGDHPNSAVAPGPDGKLYFGIGTATNAGVVGEDNIRAGWVKTNPDFRDIPCKTVTVKGSNYTIANPLTEEPQDKATTGAFSPFGKTTARLQVFQGALPCTGAIFRVNPDGTDLALVAWGLRNPASLAFGPDGQLYTTMQGFDDRGSRPIVGDSDYLYRVQEDRWYGWPDYAGGRSVTEEPFQKPSFPAKPLLAEPPEQPPAPIASLAYTANGLIFPPDSFGLHGDALVALSPPRNGAKPQDPAQRMVARVNPRSGKVTTFVRNDASDPGALLLHNPVSFAAGANGAIYLADLGQTRYETSGPTLVAGTGNLWVITRAATPQTRASHPAPYQWQWGLFGAVLSVAGARLVTLKE